MGKKIIIWVVGVVLTLAAAIYQKASGPTYPLKIETQINGKDFGFKLTRSATIEHGCKVQIPLSDLFNSATIIFRKYPGNFSYDTLQMVKNDEQWEVNLPVQPSAAKLQYYVALWKEGDIVFENSSNQAVVRFKGDVPAGILIPHVIAMFVAMLFSTIAILMVIFRTGNVKRISYITIILLFVGGLILGPIVQYYAFGDAWTGWPYGGDLTDNKTLIAFVFWLLAVAGNWKKDRKWLIVVASIVLLTMYLIPHSALGSEYNHETGKIETGK